MRKIKVVQIGTGHDHAPASMKTLRLLDDLFEVLGYVFVNDGEQSIENEKNPCFSGIKKLTLEEAFAISDLDAVVIETDDSLLTKYASLALRRGLAVQMDKPGSQSIKEFNETFDYAYKNHLVIHTGYMYRYNPAIKKALSLIKSGEIGDVYSIEAQMSCNLLPYKRAWLKNFKGGMINFLGCHLIDLILQIMGEPKQVVPLSSVSRLDLGGEDVGFAVLKYDNCTATVKTNCMEAGGPMRRKLVVVGEKGTIEVNPIEYPIENRELYSDIRVALSKNDTWYYRPEPETFGPFHRYREMFTEFSKIVNGEIENPYSYEYEKTLHSVLIKACGGLDE